MFLKMIYRDAHCSLKEALPLGNGHFGGMAHTKRGTLGLSVNHYDIYYRQHEREKEPQPVGPTDDSEYRAVMQRAIAAHEDPTSIAHDNYNFVIDPETKDEYGVLRDGNALPFTGRILFDVDEGAHFESELDLLTAVHTWRSGERSVATRVAPEEDIILIDAHAKAIQSVTLLLPIRRSVARTVTYGAQGEDCIYLEGQLAEADGTPFSYRLGVKAIGGEDFSVSAGTDGVRLAFTPGEEMRFVAAVVTSDEGEDLEALLEERLTYGGQNGAKLVKAHEDYWKKFWSASRVSLPDPILEKLWYMGVYELDCCCGRGARLNDHACGLNGLWDIDPPNQWGSKFYWDVNIQEAFWGVYASNHLDTAKSYNDAFMTYVPAAERRAKEAFGLTGIATDYPFHFYNTTWPWCAQHLWWYYRYSGDRAFLRDTAFYVFRGLLRFYEGYLKYDEEEKVYYIFPDICPEQGPMGRDSTIALACLKFLLQIGIRSSEILGEDEAEREKWKNILANLAPYARAETEHYGEILCDARWAPEGQFLAHNGVCMPIYPLGEFSVRSDAHEWRVAKNTLDYACERQAVGTHNGGWQAATAARLGDGDRAVRLLYDRFIDFMLLPSGLFCERTDRWLQSCLTVCQPVSDPPLIEASSSLVATVNDMLLHSFGDYIEVFPALPKGHVYESKKTPYDTRQVERYPYAGWEDCSFEGLLCEGGFEVTARRTAGKTAFVTIKSRLGGECRLKNPFERDFSANVAYSEKDGILIFETAAGDSVTFSAHGQKAEDRGGAGSNDGILVHRAVTSRRVYLGMDADTAFYRALDDATFDFYQGEIPVPRMALYRFDMSLAADQLPKRYETVLPRQFHTCGKAGMDFIRFGADTLFTPSRGFGLAASAQYADAEGPDELRRDCIYGKQENAVRLELRAGVYTLYFSTGSAGFATKTFLSAENGAVYQGEMLEAGRFEMVRLPVIMREDGVLTLHVAGRNGLPWAIGLLIVNQNT